MFFQANKMCNKTKTNKKINKEMNKGTKSFSYTNICKKMIVFAKAFDIAVNLFIINVQTPAFF